MGFNELALEVGVVGPVSLAARTQELLPREKKVEMPRGWDNPLGNELGAVLTCTRGARFPFGRGGIGMGHDVAPYLVGALGTVRQGVKRAILRPVFVDRPSSQLPLAT